MNESERRIAPRMNTEFFAVEIRGEDRYQRLVRNISASGYSFHDQLASDRPGDPILMDFPIPGSDATLRVAGRIVYVKPDRGIGVRIEQVDKSAYAKVLADPPALTGPFPIPANASTILQ